MDNPGIVKELKKVEKLGFFQNKIQSVYKGDRNVRGIY